MLSLFPNALPLNLSHFREAGGMGTDGAHVTPELGGKPVSSNGEHLEKPVHRVAALEKSWSSLHDVVHLLH